MLNVVPKPQTNKNLIQKHTNPKYASLKSVVEDAFSMPLKSQAPPSEACVCVCMLVDYQSHCHWNSLAEIVEAPVIQFSALCVCVCVCVKQKNG